MRAVLGAALVALCPGWAVVRLLDLDDLLERVVLAIAVSLALATASAALLMYGGWWSPGRGMAVLLAVTVAAGSLERSRGARERLGQR